MRNSTCLCLLVLFVATQGYALDNEDLQDWQSKNRLERERKKNSVTINDPSKLIPEKKKRKKKRRGRKKVKRVRSDIADKKDIVISPKPISLTNSRKYKVFSDSTNYNQNLKWGIPWGSWTAGKLVRPVNSHDLSIIEILTTSDVIGKFRVIPSGTLLSGSHVLNPDTNRLAIHVYRGITPDGKEFKLVASIYDLQRQNGLQGYSSHKPGPKKTIDQGIKNTGQQILQSAISPFNPIAAGITSTANEIINQQFKEKVRENSNNIRIDPQKIMIRFDESL